MNALVEGIAIKFRGEAENKRMSQCCTCGALWLTGTNGSHSCSEFMIRKDILLAVLKDSKAIDAKSAIFLTRLFNLNKP